MVVYNHLNITICSPSLQLKSLVIIKTVIITFCCNLDFAAFYIIFVFQLFIFYVCLITAFLREIEPARKFIFIAILMQTICCETLCVSVLNLNVAKSNVG